MANGNPDLQDKLVKYKENLKNKIVEANEELAKIKYQFKTN
jgi:5-(carboxyamino)imidazole ribonucleotide mutase